MSKHCPLMAFHIGNRLGGEVKCLGEKCELADEAGRCLIKQFLELQVSKFIKEKEAAETYWATKKEGTRLPFVIPPLTEPTKDVLVDSRVPNDGTPEFKPPHCQQKESSSDYYSSYYSREKSIYELLHDPHDRSACGS